MFRRKPAPDLIRGGYRFAAKSMRHSRESRAWPGSAGTGHALDILASLHGEHAMAAAAGTPKKVKASMMNAIHDLPLLVARDEGFFADQGLDVEIVKTPGTGQRGAD